jgi:[protein-PII] uridylyltransferase
VAGKPNDRLSMSEQDEVAALLNYSDADELLKRVYESGRTLAFESDGAWSRASKVLKPKNFISFKKIEPSRRAPLANGVVVQDGEVVLARDATLISDEGFIWRIAAASAQAGLQISPSTIRVLTSNPVGLVAPWSAETLNDFVSFLGAGQPMLPIWEALDQAGLIEKLIPHWSAIRFAPQRNALHIYTVDRHSVECAIEAAKLTRKVSRPDLLLVGSLFHDIGKARGGDHSIKGSELMAEIAPQIGFNQVDSQLLKKMVELHLLLPEVAARRDLDDIETINFVAEKIESKLLLELLHNLAIADSRATSPQNWSDWKANLILELVDRVSSVLEGKPLPSPISLSETFPFAISVETKIKIEMSHNLDVHIMTKDRIGLVADVAAAYRILKLEVLAAQFETKDGIALQHWKVRPLFGLLPDAKEIEIDILAAINNSELVLKRIEKLVFGNGKYGGFIAPQPVFYFVEDSGNSSDILEVRAHDEPALLFRLSQVLVKHEVSIIAAIIDTIGSEVIDVLYLQSTDGSKLTETQKAAIIADIGQELLS